MKTSNRMIHLLTLRRHPILYHVSGVAPCWPGMKRLSDPETRASSPLTVLERRVPNHAPTQGPPASERGSEQIAISD